ncbi:MAG: DUF4317 domain-containing protein [Clostridiales bacterium]|nr:DUF4317 domain-containing protein [Clostridiales bacterium]
MTQKDIATIKRRLNPQKRNPSMIRGCYVDSNGNILTTFRKSVVEIPTEDLQKYLTIFRKSLSGTYGQQLLPIEFSNEQVSSDTAYEELMGLCRTELEDENVANAFYEKIISWMRSEFVAGLQSVEEQQKRPNYLILFMYDSFDVAFKHPDGEEDMEMSESIFNYVICAVCPVQQSKEALGYYENEAAFHSRPSDWVVTMPDLGFMFPSMENGSANISQALYYTKDSSNVHDDFIRNVFHGEIKMNASEQKETVCSMLQNTLKEECSMDVVQAVNDKVGEMIAQQKEDKAAEPLQLSSHDVTRVLESAGVSEEKVEAFRQSYKDTFGEKAEIPAVNVVSTKEFKVVTPSVQIKVAPEHSDLVTTRVIDGQKYIMILADGDVEVNGVNIAIQ